MQVVQRGSGIARVFGHEFRQGIWPASRRGAHAGAAPVPLDTLDDRRAGDLEAAVPLPEVTLIISLIG
jgi:hypothetical protein